jgi:DNA (cytosine-5)-methyltransferase 1
MLAYIAIADRYRPKWLVWENVLCSGFLPNNGSDAETIGYQPEIAPTLRSGCNSYGVQIGMTVRRLTPIECARLQGFPDTYLDIPFRGKLATDGHKYKALGNSMAVPVMRWIGERIAMVSELSK